MGLIYEPIKEIKIKVEWRDQASFTIKEFKTVQELAEFLKEHPPLAKAVNYVSKNKK